MPTVTGTLDSRQRRHAPIYIDINLHKDISSRLLTQNSTDRISTSGHTRDLLHSIVQNQLDVVMVLGMLVNFFYN